MRISGIALGVTLFWMLACGSDWRSVVPTYDGYEAQIKAFVGRSVNDAVASLGAPTRTVELAAGHQLYVWEEKSTARTAVRGTSQYNPQTHKEEIVVDGGDRIPLDCTTELETAAGGTVVRYRIDGPACVGVAP